MTCCGALKKNLDHNKSAVLDALREQTLSTGSCLRPVIILIVVIEVFSG